MFSSKKTETTALQDAIEALLRELAGHEGSSEEYARIVERLTELHKLQEPTAPPLSKDVIVNAAASLGGILLILNHERAHVVTSKALGFVMKLR